ncbi:MAG: ParA family protein [Candidatus Nanopelagicales bacterium]
MTDERLARVVAIMNGKGGVGKTSLAGNIAALSAAAGYRVLVVDLDPQGNLAEELGYIGEASDDAGEGLATAMQFGRSVTPTKLREGLEVLPGGEFLEDLESVLGTRSDRTSRRTDAHSALAASLAPVAGEYDLVLLDCPPGSPSLQTAALGAARWLIIPTRTDDSSRKGLVKVARRYADARERGAAVELLGVCLFGVTSSARKVRAEAREDLQRDLGDVAPVFQTVIRYAEAAAVESRRRGVAVHELEAAGLDAPRWYERLRNPSLPAEVVPGSAASLAGDYAQLAQEILRTLQERESEVDLRVDDRAGART